jgi:uncharacterized protein (DUF433 family)
MSENVKEEVAMRKNVEMDWTQCELVERIVGKQGGVPLIKGTRIPAQQIVEEHELGSPVKEIAENYPSITREQIKALISYARKHNVQPVS